MKEITLSPLSKAIVITSICCVSLFSVACCKNRAVEKPEVINRTVAPDNYNYTGSESKGNYVWGGAMNLAWNELTDNIVKEPIRLKTDDKQSLAMLEKLNSPVITTRDLDDASYYVKSGFGPATQDIINKESRAKFPSKTFDDLDYDLGEFDIISYAYFLKEIEYQIAFEKQDVQFSGDMVKGFSANENSGKNIYILEYQDKDNFLVGIRLKDSKDQIFLGKGYPMERPDAIVAKLRALAPAQKTDTYSLGSDIAQGDVFQAPILKLDYERDYVEMLNKVLLNRIGGREYYIDVMKEKIKFDMDEKGARVENEAVIVARLTSVGPGQDKRKIMMLDKPYWVVMKRFDSANPYFILGVNNTELMQKTK
jgi:hypothetical protein